MFMHDLIEDLEMELIPLIEKNNDKINVNGYCEYEIQLTITVTREGKEIKCLKIS